jgi:antitoxin component YwqK of YwqJK toxin-antitoxin module
MKKLKLHQFLLLAILQFLFTVSVSAQYKSFKLNEKGDTLNAVDKNNMKQGRWVAHVDALRGEPGYEEEGVFKNNGKEGLWRRYNLTGDLLAMENYSHGGKDGTQQYFTYLGDLERVENWRGYNPDAPYDTIAIYGTGSNEIIDYKIVKAEQYSVKNGEWKYYDPATGRVMRTELWDRNVLKLPDAQKKDVVTAPKKKIEKTPEMLEWEKKNKGKKRVVRDGSTGL